jgi:hypothetical protein
MRFGTTIILLAASLVMTSAAYAWNSDGHGNIRCGDGSSAKAVQQSDGTWTVTQAGSHGTAGGNYPTEGKAALAACGEG